MLLTLLFRLPTRALRYRVRAALAAFILAGSAGFSQAVQPKPLTSPAADYPPALRMSGREGTAVIRVTVSRQGVVTEAAVSSADHPAFGEAALAAARQWTFVPASSGGDPSASSIDVPFIFAVPLQDRVTKAVGREVFVELDEPVIQPSVLRVRPSPKKPLVPVYPKEMVGSGLTGEFKIDFTVTTTGKVVNPTIPPEGPDALRVAAVVAVANAEFSPIFHEGKAVNCQLSAVVRMREPKPAPKARNTPPPISERRLRDDS
jgi:TonB family protein